jgi:ABC-type antimicrobial peptide transport system permease subunit
MPTVTTPHPPRWAQKLLDWFGHPDTLEEVQGDLLELYGHWVKTVGERKARWLYGLSVLTLLRPFARSKQAYPSPSFFSPVMIRNYLTIAVRNLIRNKAYSFINIGGLAIGMAVALLIGLWIWDEVSFDTYHQNYDRLAQVMDTKTFNGETSTSQAVAIPLANELRTKYGSDFKRMALVFPSFTHILAIGDKKIAQPGVWAQPDLPEMLTLAMRQGKRDALKDPSSALLAQSLAEALFGKADPMGKVVKLDNRTYVKVAGVFEDLPRNTTFQDTKLFLSWNKVVNDLSWVKEAEQQWDTQHWWLFVELNDHVDIAKLNARIKGIEQRIKPESKPEVLLHPMAKWHLYSEFKNGQSVGGRIQLIWLFGIIGGFVLLLACINFMNLSTARSEKRAKEVGIRKAVGSVRGQLISQFLSESVLVAFLALVLMIGLVTFVLPLFNKLADKSLVISWSDPTLCLIILAFTLLTGVLAGSYPAFYLSSFESVKVLKGNGPTFRIGRFASVPRQALVVVQFTVSISLIIGTVVIYQQIQHAKNRPVGYTREGLITIQKNTPELFQVSYQAIRNDLLQSGAVDNMAYTSAKSTDTPAGNTDFEWRGKEPGTSALIQTVGVSHDYGKTMGWKILQGRDFSRQYVSDSSALILNETAAKLMGFSQSAIGEIVRWGGKPRRVVGVVKDLVMESPYHPIQPCLFLLDYEWGNFITIRLKPSLPTREALAKIEPVFKTYNPGSPFEFKFIDEEYARKFSDEERIGNLGTVFAVLAILISCLGLFGLASFVAEQRTKEIGVRKVLGASLLNVWGLLSKDFIILVVIAFFIATPTAYYFLQKWLANYEYRVAISWWIFIGSGASALGITLLTVSFQTIKAALINPVKSLRSE